MAFDRAYDPTIDDLNARLRHATPQEILKAAFAAYPGKIAIVSSFGAESAVLLHMAAKIDANVPVLFLDTGQHFGRRWIIARPWCSASASPTSATCVPPSTIWR